MFVEPAGEQVTGDRCGRISHSVSWVCGTLKEQFNQTVDSSSQLSLIKGISLFRSVWYFGLLDQNHIQMSTCPLVLLQKRQTVQRTLGLPTVLKLLSIIRSPQQLYSFCLGCSLRLD